MLATVWVLAVPSAALLGATLAADTPPPSPGSVAPHATVAPMPEDDTAAEAEADEKKAARSKRVCSRVPVPGRNYTRISCRKAGGPDRERLRGRRGGQVQASAPDPEPPQ